MPGVVAAADVVTAPDGVLGLLERVYIADDLAAARLAWQDAPDDATFVTRAGDVLTRFVLRGGSGAKRSRLELVAERDAASASLATVTTRIERTRFALAERRGALETATTDAATALTALREYDAALAAQSEQLGRSPHPVGGGAGGVGAAHPGACGDGRAGARGGSRGRARQSRAR